MTNQRPFEASHGALANSPQGEPPLCTNVHHWCGAQSGSSTQCMSRGLVQYAQLKLAPAAQGLPV